MFPLEGRGSGERGEEGEEEGKEEGEGGREEGELDRERGRRGAREGERERFHEISCYRMNQRKRHRGTDKKRQQEPGQQGER